MKIQHDEDYRKLRRAAYPPVGEQLDAVYKLARAMRDSDVALPSEVEAWMAQLARVKETFKKP